MTFLWKCNASLLGELGAKRVLYTCARLCYKLISQTYLGKNHLRLNFDIELHLVDPTHC
jgi:hypothetical protein